jgi:hypothetical protein
METTRKTWIAPQVFILGAEETKAYQAGGVLEDANHQDGLWTHTVDSVFNQIKGESTFTYDGYQS